MKVTQCILLISILTAASSAQATTPLLDSALNSQTVYSGAAITLGAGSSVGGNLQAERMRKSVSILWPAQR
jgi:hypothetical protein